MSTHGLARARESGAWGACERSEGVTDCFTTGTAMVGLELLHLWQLASYRNQMFALTIRSMSVNAMFRQLSANCDADGKNAVAIAVAES